MEEIRQSLSPQALRSVPELKYVNADNVVRYRAIMRFFYQEYKRLNYWLKPEDIFAGVSAYRVIPDYTPEQCQSDLDQLVAWQNLTARHDGGRSLTLAEYLRKKMQYLLRPYSIEIERLLESLEKVTGYGGSLEASLFDTIADKLFAVRKDTLQMSPEAALELWNELYRSFVSLHENAADYIASLQTARAEEMMETEAFLVYKDKLTQYLQNFVQALQRSAYRIEGNLEQIKGTVRDAFLEKVVEGEWLRPRLEETATKEEMLAELQHGWENIHRWFLGRDGAPSELTLLERATKDAIARIVRAAIRIQERRRSGLNRKKELDYLARWFAGMERLEEAHCLAGYVFGLFPTRHLQGEDPRTSDRADMSMWEEQPMTRSLRSRSRKRTERSEAEPVPDNGEKKRREKEAFLLRQAEEWEAVSGLLERGRFRISELGPVDFRLRLRLLAWIGRAVSSGRDRHSFVTPEGVRIRVTDPFTKERTVLNSDDGNLDMPDYELEFELGDALLVSPALAGGALAQAAAAWEMEEMEEDGNGE